MPVSSMKLLDIQATVECRFTLKHVRDNDNSIQTSLCLFYNTLSLFSVVCNFLSHFFHKFVIFFICLWLSVILIYIFVFFSLCCDFFHLNFQFCDFFSYFLTFCHLNLYFYVFFRLCYDFSSLKFSFFCPFYTILWLFIT